MLPQKAFFPKLSCHSIALNQWVNSTNPLGLGEMLCIFDRETDILLVTQTHPAVNVAFKGADRTFCNSALFFSASSVYAVLISDRNLSNSISSFFSDLQSVTATETGYIPKTPECSSSVTVTSVPESKPERADIKGELQIPPRPKHCSNPALNRRQRLHTRALTFAQQSSPENVTNEPQISGNRKLQFSGQTSLSRPSFRPSSSIERISKLAFSGPILKSLRPYLRRAVSEANDDTQTPKSDVRKPVESRPKLLRSRTQRPDFDSCTVVNKTFDSSILEMPIDLLDKNNSYARKYQHLYVHERPPSRQCGVDSSRLQEALAVELARDSQATTLSPQSVLAETGSRIDLDVNRTNSNKHLRRMHSTALDSGRGVAGHNKRMHSGMTLRKHSMCSNDAGRGVTFDGLLDSTERLPSSSVSHDSLERRQPIVPRIQVADVSLVDELTSTSSVPPNVNGTADKDAPPQINCSTGLFADASTGDSCADTAKQSTSSYLKEQFLAFFQPSDNKLAMKLFGSKNALLKEKKRQAQQGKWVIHPCSSFRRSSASNTPMCDCNTAAQTLMAAEVPDNINHTQSTSMVYSRRPIAEGTEPLIEHKYPSTNPDPNLMCFYWDLLMLVLLIANLIILPVAVSFFNDDLSIHWIVFNSMSDVIFIADIVVKFRTGRTLRILRLAKLLSMLRLLRLTRLVRYVSQWEENADWFQQYTWALFKAMSHMLSIGYGRFPPISIGDAWITIVSMMSGATCYALFVGHAAALIQSFDTSKRLYNEKFKQVEEYMAYRKLPRALRQRIANYYEHRYQGKMFDEAQILNEFSECLREQVINYNCRALVAAVPFFTYADQDFVSEVVTKLKFEVFQPGDLIVKEGTLGNKMYFIQEGIVDIITKDGEVATSLSDGSYFGEIALLTNACRVASVKAVVYSNLYSLDRDSFHSVLNNYPLMRRTMESVAAERLSKIGQNPAIVSNREDLKEDLSLVKEIVSSAVTPEESSLEETSTEDQQSPVKFRDLLKRKLKRPSRHRHSIDGDSGSDGPSPAKEDVNDAQQTSERQGETGQQKSKSSNAHMFPHVNVVSRFFKNATRQKSISNSASESEDEKAPLQSESKYSSLAAKHKPGDDAKSLKNYVGEQSQPNSSNISISGSKTVPRELSALSKGHS
ncbi:unnamed protein product [Calicophoron daubneyi]|uniref:Cyclic nucleotide-binding domain-containing protein n=1 Tax=Calicophoron daubneyi TaxID=300641 RepID=A0AAV2TQP8_CALDB